ncbi:V-type ATP synthase subunit D [Coprothermobacteraceae bacterium]|nr:V-type ATP synthase subunit D [Coprothermobacteraceae bacterium]
MLTRLNVSPNRMTLLRIKKRYAVSKRGLKLLKDKLEAMVKAFRDLYEEFERERRYIEDLMSEFNDAVDLYQAETSPLVREQLGQTRLFDVSYRLNTRTVFNIRVPFLEVELKPLPQPDLTLQTGPSFQRAISVYQELLPHLLKLGSLENALYLMSAEIEKTRRRSNALEYTLVPQLEMTLKWVQQYLDEMERSQTVRLMKIKNILEKARRG